MDSLVVSFDEASEKLPRSMVALQRTDIPQNDLPTKHREVIVYLTFPNLVNMSPSEFVLHSVKPNFFYKPDNSLHAFIAPPQKTLLKLIFPLLLIFAVYNAITSLSNFFG
jgi:hypothetical protein